MDVTKPYVFIRFGAIDVPNPYKFIRFGATRAWTAPPAGKPFQKVGRETVFPAAGIA